MDYLTYMKFLRELIREDSSGHDAFDEFTKEDAVKADYKNQSNYHHHFSFDARDTEEDCIERIQKLINVIYQLNPNLDYEYRPRLIVSAGREEESGISETMHVKSSKQEPEKLESNVKESITNTLNDIQLKINIDTTEAIQQLQRIQKALQEDEEVNFDDD